MIQVETPGTGGGFIGWIDSGPAMIEDVATTIVVEPGWNVTVHETGVYVPTAQA